MNMTFEQFEYFCRQVKHHLYGRYNKKYKTSYATQDLIDFADEIRELAGLEHKSTIGTLPVARLKELHQQLCDTVVESASELSTDIVSNDELESCDEHSESLEDVSMDLREHKKLYWFDEKRDVYVCHLPSRKKPLALRGAYWRGIRDAYSNWDGAPQSMNEICRKFGLSRHTLVELLRVMETTHSSPPWTDEVLAKTDEEELIQDLLRRKEERVITTAERREWNRIKRDAERYRSLEMFSKRMKLAFEDLKLEKVDVPRVQMKKSTDPFVVVLSPTDFHWGKYGGLYGKDPYNRTIAKERLYKHTERVLNAVEHRGRPDEIYLVLGSDGMHIDNMFGDTTRGTRQDMDGTPREIADTYIEMWVDYVFFVKQFAPIRLFVMEGNHDRYTSILLRSAFRALYKFDEEIRVHDCISPRQTVLYGKNLLTFVHGDDGAVKDYPLIIAGEDPKLWGKSSQRFIFTGHLHTERELPNFGDVTVYRMPSLAGSDDFHSSKGYKSRKALIGYIVSETRGVVATEISPVEK